jgi:hypothetical protein
MGFILIRRIDKGRAASASKRSEPRWRPVIGVVLPPLWHQGRNRASLCPGSLPRGNRSAADNSEAQRPRAGKCAKAIPGNAPGLRQRGPGFVCALGGPFNGDSIGLRADGLRTRPGGLGCTSPIDADVSLDDRDKFPGDHFPPVWQTRNRGRHSGRSEIRFSSPVGPPDRAYRAW